MPVGQLSIHFISTCHLILSWPSALTHAPRSAHGCRRLASLCAYKFQHAFTAAPAFPLTCLLPDSRSPAAATAASDPGQAASPAVHASHHPQGGEGKHGAYRLPPQLPGSTQLLRGYSFAVGSRSSQWRVDVFAPDGSGGTVRRTAFVTNEPEAAAAAKRLYCHPSGMSEQQ